MENNCSRINYNDVDFNKHPSIAYVDPLNAKFLAINLLTFGIMIFHGALKIKNFKEYVSLNIPLEEASGLLDIVKKYVEENAVDNFRIVTCFENYMKAKILMNGQLVHMIKGGDEKYKAIRKEQFERPISITEVSKIEPFVFDTKQVVHATLPGIIKNTIQISSLIKPKYQAVISLPGQVLSALTEYIDYRNNHHLMLREEFIMSSYVVNNLREIKDYVQGTILPLYQKLEEELKPYKS
jgi:hypothetical protein